ncbi:MAG TPA: hypothetical protein VF793_13225, partial [Telluria sp.]
RACCLRCKVFRQFGRTNYLHNDNKLHIGPTSFMAIQNTATPAFSQQFQALIHAIDLPGVIKRMKDQNFGLSS